MSIAELILLALGLAMDAFAVSVCKGLAVGGVKWKHLLLCGVWFGGAQALMPFFGYLLGAAFEEYIKAFDHWVAFGLLLIIGVSMLREAFSPDEDEGNNASFAPSVMLVMAIATSIDALAAGITFGVMPNVDLPLALGLIGGLTFCLSAVGVKVGSVFGARYRTAAQICGGVLLILLGCKILFEHLGWLVL